MSSDRSLPRWLLPALLALCAAGLVGHALAYNFVCDDAFISFRYSYNFAYHNELVFNLGERVEGYTNFLWTLLLGLLLKVGLLPEVMSLVLGALCGICVLGLLYALSRIYRGGKPTAWDLVPAALLPTWGCFAVWCSGGLETQLFAALALSGITLYLWEDVCRSDRRYSGLVFALSAMARPEGLLLFGLTGLHRIAVNLIRDRRVLPTRGELFWAAGFLVPFGLFMLWRMSYYGYPFPNTFYVKGDSGWQTVERWGLPYLWDFVHRNRFYALAALFVLPIVLWRRRRRLTLEATRTTRVTPATIFSYLLLICVTYLAYVTWVGGDFMAMGRFFAPVVVPLLAFFAAVGLRATASCFRHSGIVGAALLLLLLGGSVANSAWLHGENQKLRYYRPGLDTIAYLKKFADDRIIIGSWMRRHLPADTYYSVGGAGASVYASRLRALDALGLADEWIAHNMPGAKGGRPGHSKFAPEHYFLKKKVDLVCHIGKHQDWPYRPSRGEARRWNRKGYRWVCLAPDGVRPRYYCCLHRIAKDLGPFLVVPEPLP